MGKGVVGTSWEPLECSGVILLESSNMASTASTFMFTSCENIDKELGPLLASVVLSKTVMGPT